MHPYRFLCIESLRQRLHITSRHHTNPCFGGSVAFSFETVRPLRGLVRQRARHSPSMVSLHSVFERKYHTFSRSTTHLI
ncbi:unnamed protein product [Boreogadus saida]